MANKKQQKAAPVPFAFYLLHLRWQQFVIINQRPLLLLLMVYGQIWLWEIPIVRFSVTVPLFKWRKRINVVTLLCFTLFLFYFSWKTWFMNFGASKPNHKPWKFILKIMFSNLFKLLFCNVILGLMLWNKNVNISAVCSFRREQVEFCVIFRDRIWYWSRVFCREKKPISIIPSRYHCKNWQNIFDLLQLRISSNS